MFVTSLTNNYHFQYLFLNSFFLFKHNKALLLYFFFMFNSNVFLYKQFNIKKIKLNFFKLRKTDRSRIRHTLLNRTNTNVYFSYNFFNKLEDKKKTINKSYLLIFQFWLLLKNILFFNLFFKKLLFSTSLISVIFNFFFFFQQSSIKNIFSPNLKHSNSFIFISKNTFLI